MREGKSLIAGCTASGEPKNVCGCVWNELRGHGIATEHQVARLGADMSSTGMPGYVQQAIDACATAP